MGPVQWGVGRWVGIFAVATLMGGCGSARVQGRPLAVPVEQVEDAVREAGRPSAPTVAIFEWRLNEQGSRLQGRGVARFEAPYRARLDLFTENGETAARAALVDDDLRTPPDVDRRLIPPPALLWASLGFFRPGADAELVRGVELDGGRVRLHYRLPGPQDLLYVIRNDSVESVELSTEESEERLELEWSGEVTVPSEAVYRDLSEFRELRVTLESVEDSEPFSSEIWTLGENAP